MRRLCPLLPLLIVVATAAAGCSARIACVGDDDCPVDLPVCSAGFCGPSGDGEEGEGEEGEGEEGEGEEGEGEGGEGEGEGCAVDGDCGNGLCWLDDVLVPDFFGQCLPGLGVGVACAPGTASRDPEGPLLAVVSLAAGDPCNPGPELTYTATVAWRDAEGDVAGSGFGLRVTAPGGAPGNYDISFDNSTGRSGDGETGTTTFFFCAFASPPQLGLQLFDDDDDGSNVVCVVP